MPPNQVEVKLKFARRRSAKVMGQLAATAEISEENDGDSKNKNDGGTLNEKKNNLPVEGEVVEGILVTQNFQSKIVTPSDIATYTPLRVGSIASKLHVPFAGSIHTLQLFLHEMFENITEQPINEDDESSTLDNESERSVNVPVMYTLHNGEVRIIMGQQPRVVIVEWQASPAGDILADAVVALIMHAQSSAASIRYTSKPCHHPRDISSSPTNDDEATQKKIKPDDLVSDRLRFIRTVLKEQFQNVEAIYDAYKGTYDIVTDMGFEAISSTDGTLHCQVIVEFDNALASTAKITVECPDHKIASNIQTTLQNAIAAAAAVRT
jgi:Pre-mRNA 3'-end-processing endonuclease polyadenylation factor C-term